MRIMEIVWLLAGLLSLIGGIHAWSQHDMKNALIFFLMVLISFFMFTFRMRLRKKNEHFDQKGE